MKFTEILSKINGDITFEEASKKYRLVQKIEDDGVCICGRIIKKMYIFQHEDENKDILILGSGCKKTLSENGYFGEKIPRDIVKTKEIKSGGNKNKYNQLVEHFNNYKLQKCKICNDNFTRYNYDTCQDCKYDKNCKTCKITFSTKYNNSKECKKCYNMGKSECAACEGKFKKKFNNQLICGCCYKQFKNHDHCLECDKSIDSKYFFCYGCNKKLLK